MFEDKQEIASWLRDLRKKLALAKAVGVALLDGKAEERYVSLLTGLDAVLAGADALLDGLSSENVPDEDTPPR